MMPAIKKGASVAAKTTRRNFTADHLFFILILLTPLVIIPRIFPSWEIGKVVYFLTVVEAWFWSRLFFGKVYFPKRIRFVLLSLFLFLTLLLAESSLLGGNSFLGGYWRHQGWWFMTHLGIMFYLLVTAELDQKFILHILRTTLYLVVFIGLVTWPFSPRLTGTLGEANSLGLFAALSLVLSAWIKQPWFMSPILTVGLLLSQSRSAVISLAPLLFRLSRPIRIIALVSAITFLIFFNFARGGGERFGLWSSSFALWQTRPWLGHGLGNFQEAFSVFMQNKGLQWQRYDNPHDIILWLLVESGAVGFGLFAGWIYLVLSHAANRAFKDLALSVLIFGLFQPFSTAVWVYLFTFMALAVYAPDAGLKRFSFRPNIMARLMTVLLGIFTWLAVVWQGVFVYFH